MVKRGKPEPDIYLKACEILSLPPQACIALEDSPMGILSSYNAGMKPVMIPDLAEPDADTKKLLYSYLTSLSDVINLLEQTKERS
jgi:beta-phosphoglucomutase-like phosphatase (HAD superfamily)